MNINNFLNYHTNVNLNDLSKNEKKILNKAYYYKIFKRNGYVVIRNFLDKKDIDITRHFYKKLITRLNN